MASKRLFGRHGILKLVLAGALAVVPLTFAGGASASDPLPAISQAMQCLGRGSTPDRWLTYEGQERLSVENTIGGYDDTGCDSFIVDVHVPKIGNMNIVNTPFEFHSYKPLLPTCNFEHSESVYKKTWWGYTLVAGFKKVNKNCVTQVTVVKPYPDYFDMPAWEHDDYRILASVRSVYGGVVGGTLPVGVEVKAHKF